MACLTGLPVVKLREAKPRPSCEKTAARKVDEFPEWMPNPEPERRLEKQSSVRAWRAGGFLKDQFVGGLG